MTSGYEYSSNVSIEWEQLNVNPHAYTFDFKYIIKMSIIGVTVSVVRNAKLTMKCTIGNTTKTIFSNRAINIAAGTVWGTVATGTFTLPFEKASPEKLFDLKIDISATWESGYTIIGNTSWTKHSDSLSKLIYPNWIETQAIDYSKSKTSAIINKSSSSDINIYISPKYSGLNYDATVVFGDYISFLGNYVDSDFPIVYSPPIDWLELIGNRTNTTEPYIEIVSYNSNKKTIGERICHLTVEVGEDIKPSIGELKVEKISDIVPNGWNLLIQGNSKIKVDANNIIPGRGATLKKYVLSTNMGDISESAPLLSDTINTSGQLIVSAYAIDERNRKSDTKTMTLDIEPYALPNITTCSALRCNDDLALSDSGNRILVQLDGIISSCKGKNSVTKSIVEVKRYSNNELINTESITPGTPQLINGVYDSEFSFLVIFTVSDMLHSSQRIVAVSTSKVTLDIKSGGNGISFGKIAEHDNFECDFPAQFNKDVYIQIDGLKKQLQSVLKELESTKVSYDKIIKTTEVTEEGYIMDAKTVSDEFKNLKTDTDKFTLEQGSLTLEFTGGELKIEQILFESSFLEAPNLYLSSSNYIISYEGKTAKDKGYIYLRNTTPSLSQRATIYWLVVGVKG